MKIGVNCYFLRPGIGGLKQYFINLFNELLKQDSENRYIFFYFPQNRVELEELDNRKWEKDAFFLHRQSEIKQYLSDLDVYFCLIGGLQPLPLPPIPTVVSLLDVQHLFYPHHFKPFDLFYRDCFLRGSTQIADRIITTSEFSRKTIIQKYRPQSERLLVSYLSPDQRYYRAKEIGKSPSYPLPNEFIFYPANRWIHKNHDSLLKAIQHLKEHEGISVPVVFTGNRVDQGYSLPEMATYYGIRHLIHELDFVTVEEMAYLYCHAKFLIFPSLFEGFGLPLTEAMAAGCPIAASQRTSLPEIGGQAAIYFDPTNIMELTETIKTLWFDSKLRMHLSEEGRNQVRKFAGSRMAEIHLRAFTQAKQSFSKPRYLWNLAAYQPGHLIYVYLKRFLGEYRRKSRKMESSNHLPILPSS